MRYELRLMLAGDFGSTPISELEYDDIRVASQSLLTSTAIEEQCDLLVENYIEFQTTRLGLTARHAIVEGADYLSLHLERAVLNRRISNFLSSSKAYVDAVPQHVRDLFGVGSSVDAEVDEAFKALRDDHPSSRAISAIRNVVQHFALPIHEWGYESKWDDGQTRLTYNQSIVVDPAELAKVKGLRQGTKAAIDGLVADGKKLSIAPLMAESLEGTWAIHKLIRERIQPGLSAWRGLFSSSAARFKAGNPNAPTVAAFAAVAVNDAGELVQPIYILEKSFAYSDLLRSKNESMSRISRLAIASQ